ncbi:MULTISPECIES: ABC transporter substrate-binding protein [unclassified Solwaraspora]|uniref:ABC transporter substrate-binding protein n=1 Tax=unclassified Solwaraspora TaxID=2627926 RepID=UPI00248AC001|nr:MULTISPECIES: ABC transporter substrate-binding protein [unclassified Solwaraspora]WBB98851.1 ABC transporter substrate-binding protein [Solwaraspora sp. WMMA2059]WBC22596.1 ABC transporter substrate-binding protein [Solwaraspora sp. WMMA2080]WJK35354.1 ABC transporter substrate-binding protein [Solwaraspora sp. WMMA2065]
MTRTRGSRTRAVTMVLVAALLATACGGPAGTTEGDDQASGTIRLLTPIFEGADGKTVLEEQLDAFKEEYPDITVEVDYTSYGKLNEKLTTSIAGGRPYDVMLMGVGWIPPFAAKGALAELDENQQELAERYNERVVEPGIYQGKVYGLPIMLDTRFGLYRKDIFAEAGIAAPPSNFAELREIGRQLTVRDARGKLTRAGVDILSNDLRQTFLPLMWANGGELWTSDGQPAFNSPEAVGALQLMADIILTDKSEDFGFTQPGATGLPLAQGRAAMMVGHNNHLLAIEEQAPELIEEDKIGFFMISNERPAMFQGGTLATVSAKSQRPAAAKALVSFLTDEQASLAANEQRGNVPALNSLSDSDYVQRNPAAQFAMANLDAAYSEGGVPAWLEIRGDFKAAIESVLLGQKDPQQALDELVAKAQAAIAKG